MRVTGSAISGIILLILGVVLLLANVLGIKINFFRLFPGVILVILGIVVLFGQFGGTHEVIFDRKKIDLSEPFREKNIIFAEGVIDLNDLTELESNKKIKVNVIFGSGRLILNPEIPSVVHASSVFANLELPEHSVSFIGSTEYRSGDIQAQKSFLDIETNVIFGQMKVIKP
jgi:predicted membrane protein